MKRFDAIVVGGAGRVLAFVEGYGPRSVGDGRRTKRLRHTLRARSELRRSRSPPDSAMPLWCPDSGFPHLVKLLKG